MNKVCMILMSCDKYEDAWYPFCHQLLTNWNDFNMPIYLCTETKSYTYKGLDIRCPLSEGKVYQQWSERLLKLLKQIDSEYVLFMLDDFWLTNKVNGEAFNRVLSYMRENDSIGFICLLHEERKRSASYTVDSEFEELNEWKKGMPFRITTQAGLWRKKYLMKLLRSHESAWYFETRATWRSKFYHERVFDVKQSILSYPTGGFFWGGKCYKDYIYLYPRDILKVPLRRGTISFGDVRSYPTDAKGLSYYWTIIKSALPKW